MSTQTHSFTTTTDSNPLRSTSKVSSTTTPFPSFIPRLKQSGFQRQGSPSSLPPPPRSQEFGQAEAAGHIQFSGDAVGKASSPVQRAPTQKPALPASPPPNRPLPPLPPTNQMTIALMSSLLSNRTPPPTHPGPIRQRTLSTSSVETIRPGDEGSVLSDVLSYYREDGFELEEHKLAEMKRNSLAKGNASIPTPNSSHPAVTTKAKKKSLTARISKYGQADKAQKGAEGGISHATSSSSPASTSSPGSGKRITSAPYSHATLHLTPTPNLPSTLRTSLSGPNSNLSAAIPHSPPHFNPGRGKPAPAGLTAIHTEVKESQPSNRSIGTARTTNNNNERNIGLRLPFNYSSTSLDQIADYEPNLFSEQSDPLGLQIWDEDKDPFKAAFNIPSIVMNESLKRDTSLLHRNNGPPGLMMPSLMLMPPLSDESSASSDDPLEFPSSSRPSVPIRSFKTRTDKGIERHRTLGPDDLRLDFVFPEGQHFEFWDMIDEDYLICRLRIDLLLKDPFYWHHLGVPFNLPEIEVIEIECQNSSAPSPLVHRDAESEYLVAYMGSTTTGGTSSSSRHRASKQSPKTLPEGMIPRHGICINRQWSKLYSDSHLAASGLAGYSSEDRYQKGWFVDAWVPLPIRLFAKKESRSFTLRSIMWMVNTKNADGARGASRGKKIRKGSVSSNNSGGGSHGGSRSGSEIEAVCAKMTTITISHLLREREMLC